MEILVKILFWISLFIIFWAMMGYPLSLVLINKILKPVENKKDYSLLPEVTLMIVAHNEEKVIFDKLVNVTTLNYPKDRLKILVASDNSTDKTNEIVRDYIKDNPNEDISLFEVTHRKGKTNAQNEAQKTVKTEFLVMTDANAMLEKNAIRELMASFTDRNIYYVTGKLIYTNSKDTDSSQSESSYWNLDLMMREIESRIQTVTAGNGALYAVRTKDYIDVDLILAHDIAFPVEYGLACKRAIANHDAIAYEKAGEVNSDEYKRKVRMNRILNKMILPSIKLLNLKKYKWFTYFYLGHRTSRYLLWIAHFILLFTSLILMKSNLIYALSVIFHVIVFFLCILKVYTRVDNKIINFIFYYIMTIIAQWHAIFKIITGRSKPFWEKAETTR